MAWSIDWEARGGQSLVNRLQDMDAMTLGRRLPARMISDKEG